MGIAEFHEPIVVENLLDRLVVPRRSSTPGAESSAWEEPVFVDGLRVLFKLGAIHGVFDPDIWRATVISILEEYFGAPVQQITQTVIAQQQVKVLVYDIEQEVIVKWLE
jgi:hypothetical protein